MIGTRKLRAVIVSVAALAIVATNCRDGGSSPSDADVGSMDAGDADSERDSSADANPDGDGDVDGDVDGDTDGDGDGDTDGDGDGDSDADGDGDGDGDADSDGDADVDADADEPVDPCAGVICDVQPDDECDGDDRVTYESIGVCDGSSGSPECTYALYSMETCEFGCDSGACLDDPLGRYDINIYVDNFCNMTVDPLEVFVPAGETALLTYHNWSADYPVDVWLSYIGGFLDLMPGMTWEDGFEWCAGDSVYDGYADIDTACSSYRLMIHCL